MSSSKKILKIIFYSLLGLVVLIILLALFTQTPFFKSRLRVILASSISTNINGTLHLGTIDGNFVTGFTIDSLAIYDDEGVFVTTRKITCKYDLLPIFEKKFRVKYLIFEQPSFNFIRTTKKDWNIKRLLKSDTVSTKSTFDWTLQFDDIEIKNASVRLIDSAALADSNHWNMPASYFEYHDFSVNDINIKLSFFLNEKILKTQIQHVSCYSPQSEFELTHFKGNISITDKALNASDIIIQTGKSYIELDASLKGINIFDRFKLINLQHDTTNLQLRTKNIDLTELKSFLPQVHFLNGSADIDLNAAGEFGNLTINKLSLKTFGNHIILSGLIRNLHDPGKLFINVRTDQSSIIASDIPKLLPGSPIPQFTDKENLKLSIEFIGEPTNFKTQTSLSGVNSSINIVGEMNLQAVPPTYNFSFATRNLNIAKYFKVGNLNSTISSYGNVSGKGFTIDKLNSTLDLKIDSSTIQDLPITHSTISLNGQPDRLDLSLNLFSHQAKAIVDGSIDFPKKSLPLFDGKIELNSFDLAKLLKDDKYISDLNLQSTFSGSGNNLENLSAEINISLLPSKFQNHELDADNINLTLEQKNIKSKLLSFKSQIADGEISGNFDIVKSTSLIKNHITSLVNAIIKHARPDSANISTEPKLSKDLVDYKSMNFDYTISFKNLEPIASLIGKTPFDLKADIKGNVKYDKSMTFNCEGDINEFFVGTSKGGVLLNNSKFYCSFDSMKYYEPLENLFTKLKLSVESGLINTKSLANVNLDVEYNHLKGKISGQGVVDTNYKLITNGEISVQPNTYVFDLDSLIFSINNSTWLNEQDVQLRLNLEGLRIMHAAFKRMNERVEIAGALTRQGNINLSTEIRKFNLANLGSLLKSKYPSLQSEGLSGTVNLDLNVTGTTTAPIIKLHTRGEDIFIRKTKVGQLNIDFGYVEQTGSINIVFKENPDDIKPLLTISGTIPMNLAFSGGDKLFQDKTQSIDVKSDGLNIGIFDPLLKDFDDIDGNLKCDLKIKGTPNSPLYEGSIHLQNTKFLFNPNNIKYVINGDLEAAGNKISLNNFSIRNIPEKGLSGETKATGSITIKNFKIDTFDVTAKGQFLLMADATRKTSPSMYGTLFTETDKDGLNLKGTLIRPYLTGKLYIKEASLTFPPTKTSQIANSNLSLQYRTIDDTSKQNITDKKISKYYLEENSADTSEVQLFESPIIDRLRYNIIVETHGPTTLNMIFTPTTGEELYAELDGKVSVVNEQGTAAIYGEIEVSPRSYYNFFKRFDANGKLKFVGEWNNPELDIQAKYEGYKAEISQQLTEQTTPEPATKDETQIKEKKVIVELKITGTRYEPNLSMGMKIQNKPGEEPIDYSTLAKGGDVQSDAISFIITGKFRDELTSREQQEFTDLGTSTGSSMASSLLSSIFSDVLKKEFPFIKRADVIYRGGSVQEGTSVNVTATAFKGYLRVGGKIFQDIGNANVSYQLSLGDFFNAVSIRNLFIEIQRKVEGDNPEDKKLTNEARFYYKFSF